MRIINLGDEDYHIHSKTYSDGMSTVEEIVQFAGEMGLKKIAITDHCDATLKVYGYKKLAPRSLTERWGNVHNDIEVIFGIEGDLMNEKGDICNTLQGFNSDFFILSLHPKVYEGSWNKITEAYLNAIKRHHKQITFIGHLCLDHFEKHIDIKEVTKAANDHGIPLELDGANLMNDKTSIDNLEIMLQEADQIYVNSDAHTLWEMEKGRKRGLEFLRSKGYL